MKKILLIAALVSVTASAFADPPKGYCEVTVCNRIERFTLSPWKMMKDKWGETCTPALLGKEDAVVDKQLSSDSRWFQGSFNFTKQSVTRVKEIKKCK